MKDLTRWNRAGLSHICYVDGNAVVWLEEMRRLLLEQFENSGWAAIQDGAPGTETDAERLERLEQQYEGGPEGDLLWEIVRTLARASHVLTEHLDVYANERLLRTATQWDNVRRLVEMIDYHPAPPASANSSLVLSVPEGLAGIVEKGFKVKYSPPNGMAAVVFETLEEIEIDVGLNELRIDGWNVASGTLAGKSPWSANSDIVKRLSAGQRVVVTDGADIGKADLIQDIDPETGVINLVNSDWGTFSSATAQLLVCPDQIRSPELNGFDVVGTGSSHGLTSGDLIAWNKNSVWNFRTVLEVGPESVRLEGDDFPAISQTIYPTSKIDRTSVGILFPDMNTLKVAAYSTSGTYTPLNPDALDPEFTEVSKTINMAEDDTIWETSRYNILTAKMMDVNQILIVSDNAIRIKVQNLGTEELVFLGGPGSLKSGDWVVVEDEAESFQARRVKEIEEREDRFILEFEALNSENANSQEALGIVRVFGPFKHEISPTDFDSNQTELSGEQLSSFSLVRDSEAWPPALRTGRRLVIEQDDTGIDAKAMVATVSKIEGKTISVHPPLLESDGYTKGNTVIRANVVRAGHGEAQPDRVLGSGDAAMGNQRFIFKNEDVAFVSDAAMAAGVRADIEIRVENRTWIQVSRLTDSGPADPHFELKITGDGYLQISFGDGMRGRRLPTGSNNIRISWRKGSGLGGMVEAKKLVKPVKPHWLIDSVEQPFSTTGGSNLEEITSLRENAPASLLTLERAVSINDFKYLATSHSSVWQANAFLRNTHPNDSEIAVFAREETIEVVVVPSGGGDLGELSGTLTSFIEEHSLPGVRVAVSSYVPLLFELNITVRVKSAQYDPEIVVAEVRSALLEEFSLERRKLGHSLYKSEVFQVVEEVEGVENSACELLPLNHSALTDPVKEIVSENGAIKGYTPGPTQVIHLDSSGIGLVVNSMEYGL